MGYTIKKLQQWDGMDGRGCRGEVHNENGCVATFFDEGCGGEMMVEFRDAQGAEFKAWANAHPVLPLTWEDWGFTPRGDDHTEQVVEWLLVEHSIAKEVKKGYLVFQSGGPYDYGGAKQGRKKAKYTPESAAWIRSQEPNCVVRNEETPAWIVEEVKS